MRSRLRDDSEDAGRRFLPWIIVVAALVAVASVASVRRDAPVEPLLLGWVQR